MKIKFFADPTLIVNEDQSFLEITSKFNQARTHEELLECLTKGLQNSFHQPANLQKWVPVLNTLDEWITKCLQTEKVGDSSPQLDNVDRESRLLLLSILDFTSHLLYHSYNKDIYNSTELLIELLQREEDTVASKALDCVYYLALPPLNHRHDNFVHRATTQLSKNTEYFQYFQEIVDAAWLKTPPQAILADSFQPAVVMSTITVGADPSPIVVENVFELLHRDQQYINTHILQNLPNSDKRKVIWSLRVRRLLLSSLGRRQILELQMKATLILITAHPEKSALFRFFSDKLDLIKDFVWLVGNVAESFSLDQKEETLHLAVLATQCLSATLEDRDHSMTPLFVNFPWLLHDLGVTRGQYMGLIPRLLQFSVSNLYNISAMENTRAVAWIENLLLLIWTLANISTSLSALVDNGLVSSLLSLIKLPDCKESMLLWNNLLFVSSLSVELLDLALNNQSMAVSVFHESHGLDFVVDRFHHDVSWFIKNCRTHNTTNSRVKLMLQSIGLLFSSFIQEARNDSNTRDSDIHRNRSFLSAVEAVFQNAELFSSSLLTTILSVLADIINKDHSPPTILNFLLSTEVLRKGISIVPKLQSIENDLPIALVGLISAMSLVTDGQKVVEEVNVLVEVLRIFELDKNYYPNSKALMIDLPSHLGSSLEQFGRHYPTYVPILHSTFNSMLFNLIEKARNYVAFDLNVQSQSIAFDSQFAMILNKATATCSCLEQLLERKNSVDVFVENGGIQLLYDLRRLSLGPLKFLAVVTATTTNPAVQSPGYPPLIGSLRRIADKIAAHNPKALFDEALGSLALLIENVLSKLASIHVSQVSSSYPSLLSLHLVEDTPIHSFNERYNEDIICFIIAMRDLMMLTFSVELMGLTLQSKHGRAVNLICAQELRSENVQLLLLKLVDSVYLPLQKEVCRYSAQLLDQCHEKLLENTYQPNFLLRIVSESTVVKDGVDDNARRLFKLPKGMEVVAYERRVSSNGNVKYRIEGDSWISRVRNVTSSEPQVIVIDVMQKTVDENNVLYEAKDVVSFRRSGYIFITHFCQTIKNVVFSVIPRVLFPREESSSDLIQSSNSVHSIILLSVSTLKSILSSKVYEIPSYSLQELVSAEHVTVGINAMKQNFFLNWKPPSLFNVSTSHLLLLQKAVELCHAFLFEAKRSFFHRVQSSDYNTLLLLHVFSDKHLFDLIIEAGIIIVYSAMDPFAGDLEDLEHVIPLDFPSSFHEWTDEQLEKVDLHQHREEEKELITQYRKYRVTYQERRRFALLHVLKVLEFFKMLVSFFGSPPTAFEKKIIKFADETHNFNPEAFKRAGFLNITRHIYQLWFSKSLSTLPTSAVQAMLELFSSVVKCANDVKGFEYKSGITDSSRKLETFLNFTRTNNRPTRLPASLRQSVFRPSEETLNTLLDMGFERTDCLAVAQALRTNNVAQLVPMLLENPGFIATSRLQLENNPNPDEQQDENLLGRSGISSLFELLETPIDLNQNSLLLPTITLALDEDLKLEKELAALVASCLLKSAPNVYLHLIEQGPTKMNENWRESLNANSMTIVSREQFTNTLLNLMLKLLDGYNLSDETLRLVQLSWLHRRASEIISNFTFDGTSWSRLYGIVHCIVLVLAGQISGGNHLRNGGNEAVMLLMRLDERFSSVHESFGDIIRSDLGVLIESESALNCVTVILLLFDFLQQASVVDQEHLSVWIREIENIHKFNPGKVLELTAFACSPEEILSPQVKEKINLNFLGKVSAVDVMPNEEFFDEHEFLCLPLLSSGLSGKLKALSADFCCRLIESSSNWKISPAKASNLIHAAFQLVVHLQEEEEVRNLLQSNKIHLLSLRQSIPMIGARPLLLTILQRQIEDVNYLRQVMRTAVKVAYERIVRLTKIVTLKALVENIAPLFYRNQKLILGIIANEYSFRFETNQIVVFSKSPTTQIHDHQKDKIESFPTNSLHNERSELAGIVEGQPSFKKSKISEKESLVTKKGFDDSPTHQRKRSSQDSCNLVKNHRQETVQETVNEIFSKLERILIESVINTEANTFSELLLILAELVASIPACVGMLVRCAFGPTSLGRTINFIQFMLHHLLKDEKYFELKDGDEGAKVFGLTVLDSAAYLLSSLLSRPGEGRALVIHEVKAALLLSLNSFQENLDLSSLRLLKAIQLLVTPPAHWQQRESFIIPVKDIITSFHEHGLYDLLVKFFERAISTEKRLLCETLAGLIDCFLRKANLSEPTVSTPLVELTSSQQVDHDHLVFPFDRDVSDNENVAAQHGGADSEEELEIQEAVRSQENSDSDALSVDDDGNNDDDEEEEEDEEELDAADEQENDSESHHSEENEEDMEMLEDHNSNRDDGELEENDHHHEMDESPSPSNEDELEEDIDLDGNGDQVPEGNSGNEDLAADQEDGLAEDVEEDEEDGDNVQAGIFDNEDIVPEDHQPDVVESDGSSERSNYGESSHEIYFTPGRGIQRMLHHSYRSRGVTTNSVDNEAVFFPFSDNSSNHQLVGVFDGTELRLRIDRQNQLSSFVNTEGFPEGRSGFTSEGTVYQLPFGMGAVEFAAIGPDGRQTVDTDFNISIPRRGVSNSSSVAVVNAPPVNALVSVLDGRRGRGNLPSFPSFLTSSRTDPHYVLGAQIRTNRISSTNKHKTIGPLLSERRWGTDVGSLESPFSRIPTLIKAVERFLRFTLRIGGKDEPESKPTKELSTDPLLGVGVMRLMANSLLGSSLDLNQLEETKEEQELQETKDGTGDFAANNSAEISNPLLSIVHELAPTSRNVSSQAVGLPVTEPINASVVNENVEFLESLPYDLRQEVLLAAEEPFLVSLPVIFQEEARLLREQRDLEMQLFSYSNAIPATALEPMMVDPNVELARINESDEQLPVPQTEAVEQAEHPATDNIHPEIKREDPNLFTEVGITVSTQPPFSFDFAQSVLSWFHDCALSKIPSPLLRLMVDIVKYDQIRGRFLRALFDSILPNREPPNTAVVLKSSKSLFISKCLFTMHYLLKKTENIVWYEMMNDQTSLFESLLRFIHGIQFESAINFEMGLNILEKFCAPFAKLSTDQVEYLMQEKAVTLPTPNLNNASSSEQELSIASGKRKKLKLPVPCLRDDFAKLLCGVPSSVDFTNAAKKSFIRIMRCLSLYEKNWKCLLSNLSQVATDLMAKSQIEIGLLYESLVKMSQLEETADRVISSIDITCPRVMWESRLLNVLRLMTVLRSRSGRNATKESEVVSIFMRNIRSERLWELLLDCLDLVRDIEGFNEGTEETESKLLSVSTRSGSRIISALTMRFIPLIECFLTYYSKTVLVRPLDNGLSAKNNVASGMQGSGGLGLESMELVRSTSLLPGSRFRQNSSFLQMQLEVQDEASANVFHKFVEKNAQLLNMVLRHNVHLLESSFSPLITVPRCRNFLHFDVKRAYFSVKLKRLRQTASRTHGSLRIAVRRTHVFEESFQSLRHKSAEDMRRRLNVTFLQEEGVDASGLTREWYTVLAREIFNPNYALFTSTGDGVTFQPNAYSYINPEHLSYFKFIGRIIGKAICDGHLLDVHFTRSFYKHILGLSVHVNDLEPIEPEYFKSLIQILETPLNDLGLDLSFCAESNEFGKVATVDLIPNGRDVAVTDENKHEYIRLLAHHRMTSAIKKQIDAFLEGFHDLVPPELISIFDSNELELLISGLPEIDVDDLRANTDYHGYQANDPLVSQFWNIIKSLSKEDKAQFIQFVTGSSKVPLEGFKALQGADGIKRFNIHKSFGGDGTLPTAHTCFNQLDLPEYSSEEVMRDKLLLAVKEGSEGFGFA